MKSKFDTVGDDKHAHEIVKKTISASLYLLFKTNPCRDKIERTKLLQNVFNSDITHLCIYGDFYPLDFTLLNINESYFYDYGGLSRSSFPTKNTVFFYSHIDCKERAGKYKIAPKVFDESCKLTLDVQLATKFYSLTKNDAVDMVEDDLKYILKPYYSSSHFVSNPVDDFRRKPFLKCRISYEIFFNILIAHGVIVSNSKYSQISDGFQDSVKHLISNHVTDRKLKKVVEIISDCVLEG